MILPELSAIECDGETALIRFSLDDQTPYVQGHFDRRAVLPGVVQVGWAIAFTEKYFDTQIHFYAMKSVKFTQLVLPPVEVEMKLNYNKSKGLIKFQSHTPTGKCGSGIIEVRASA